MKESKRAILKLVFLSFCFLLVFLAYNGTQTIASSIIPGKMGYWSLSTVYLSLLVSSLLLSTGLVIVLTPKWSMFLGSLFYAAFIAANAIPRWYTLVPIAALVGVAGSVLWAGEGVYITSLATAHARSLGRPTRSSIGLFNGVFFGVVQLSNVIGNLLGSAILARGGSHNGLALSSSASTSSVPPSSAEIGRALFFSYCAICGVGILGLLFAPSAKPTSSLLRDSASETPSRGGVFDAKRMMGALVLLTDAKMYLLVPFLVFTGLEMGFIYGDFTAAYVKPTQGIQMVGFIMAAYGAVNSVFCVLLGRVADRFGPRSAAAFGCFAFAVFLASFGLARETQFGRSLAAAFAWAVVLGVAEGTTYSVFSNSAIATLFTDNTEAAFSNLKVFQALGTSLMFFLGPKLTLVAKLVILSAAMVVGCIGLVVLDRFVAPLSAAKHQPDPTVDGSTVIRMHTDESMALIP